MFLGPWDRVHEHLSSKRHAKMKVNYEKRIAEGKQQLTMYDAEVRSKTREKEHQGAIYDFVHAMTFCGLQMTQADSFLGDFVKKYSPALRSMPGSQQLSNKYLKEVYDDHMTSCPEIGCQLIKLIDLFDPHGMKNLCGKV